MGDLLAVLFIGTIFVVSGLVLLFATDDRGRKYGIWVLLLGLLIYLAAWFFTPDSPHYHLFNDKDYNHL
jgi:hypothetical protein